ncbi:serine/threonine-protein kinase [Fortiea contorta]|uniref:serine/threonine-protein kinase n=1 Tax=Fortiea contorta TaxID=1892405 RepID=UPI0003481324|nr:serine/threonine-protein kinase [Fortiea contorta]
MTNHMIGKVLQARYQIVQSLGAGVFGQTYIAVDIDYPENPKCVVKQLKVNSSQPSYLDTLRLRFLTETETLKRLGCHNQIPELIACFEEHERFYLVQEFIEGHSLTAELPIKTHWEAIWSESAVVEFLQDVLEILEFVHSQGVIHCDVKPENIVRRASDGKLVLIDFGSIQAIDFGIDVESPIYRVPVTSLGYIPPEQFIGQTRPNSDIYALGMIAIQALTGLSPLQLQVDSYTNEIIWRFENTPVSDYLAAILSQMIRYDYQERLQSATQVLHILKQMVWETQLPVKIIGTQDRPSLKAGDEHKKNLAKNHASSSPPLLTGMRVGLLTNSVLMGLGAYSLMNHVQVPVGTEALYKATEEYQTGDLQEAIALAKSIPAQSNIYPEAQATIDEWQQDWKLAAQTYQLVEKAFQEKKWADVFRLSAQVPDILYWQTKTEKIVDQARSNIEGQGQELLTQAFNKAADKDFSRALEHLRKVPVESSASTIAQEKLVEYKDKQYIRATYFLQKAYNQAFVGNFDSAIKFLHEIPENTPAYSQAQVKLAEYTEKQQQSQGQNVALSKAISASKKNNLQIRHTLTSHVESLNAVDDLQEVNIQSH